MLHAGPVRVLSSVRVCLLLSFLAGCGHGCGCGGASSFRVEDVPTPYVRCVGAEADQRTLAVGAGTLRIEGHSAQIDGVSRVRLGVVAGPAPYRIGNAAMPEIPADLLVVLGSIGDTSEAASETLRAVAAAGKPVLLLAGGRDRWATWEDALDALDGDVRERFVDARGLWKLEAAGTEIALLSGAPGGRYALDADACGVGDDDVDAIADTFGDPDEGTPRALIAWAAPRGWPVAVGLGGRNAGDPLVASLAKAIGAQAGVFAFPREGRRVVPGERGGQAIAPSVWDPITPDTEGRRTPPQTVLMTLTKDGIRVTQQPSGEPPNDDRSDAASPSMSER